MRAWKRGWSKQVGGNGLFAVAPITAGERLFVAVKLSPTEAEPQWCLWLNHACRPTCEVRAGWVVARQALKPGQAITIDYDLWPYHSKAWDFLCQCGTAGCRGRISNRRTG